MTAFQLRASTEPVTMKWHITRAPATMGMRETTVKTVIKLFVNIPQFKFYFSGVYNFIFFFLAISDISSTCHSQHECCVQMRHVSFSSRINLKIYFSTVFKFLHKKILQLFSLHLRYL